MRQTIALFLNNSENHIAILLEREVKKLFFSYLSCFKISLYKGKYNGIFESHLSHISSRQM